MNNYRFSPTQRQALLPPDRIKPSQWAEANRILSDEQSAEAGPFRNSRKAWMIGIVNAIQEDVESVIILKSARVGYTTSIQTLIGWIATTQPASILLAYPDRGEARKCLTEDVIPYINDTPALAALVSKRRDEKTREYIRFASCVLFAGWSTSSKSLNRRNIRYAFADELDNWVAASNRGKDASPVELMRKRCASFLRTGRARIVMGGTPKFKDGHIWKEWEGCGDKREYHLPCPHCKTFQTLAFEQVKWQSSKPDHKQQADEIEATNNAWYECISCNKRINEQQRNEAARKGVWLSEGQTIENDGTIIGEKPKTKRIGFKISNLVTPDYTFGQIAARFLRAIGDRASMQEFKNQWLAEPFDEAMPKQNVEVISRRIDAAPVITKLPSWVSVLVACGDKHGEKTGYYWVVRAFGYNYRSQLIAAGRAHTFDELREKTLGVSYEVEGSQAKWHPQKLYIDAGYRTPDVHEFCLSDPSRIIAIRGNPSKFAKPIKVESLTLGGGVITEASINTDYYKGKLADYQSQQIPWLGTEVDRWGVCQLPVELADEYAKHLTAEVEVYDSKLRRMVWQKISKDTPNHYFDCEVYATAAADDMGVGYVSPPQPPQPQAVASEATPAVKPMPTTPHLSPAFINKAKGNEWLKPVLGGF